MKESPSTGLLKKGKLTAFLLFIGIREFQISPEVVGDSTSDQVLEGIGLRNSLGEGNQIA